MAIKELLSFFFPEQCVGCSTEGSLLCPTCLAIIPTTETHPAPWITTFFSYRDPIIHALIHALKYEHARAAAEVLVDRAFPQLLSILPLNHSERIVLVPIPASHQSIRQRGFDQALLLARAITSHVPTPAHCTITIEPLLIRHRGSHSQVDMGTRAKRKDNARNLFPSIPTPIDRERTYVLIDDVMTTGSTLEAAQHRLKEAGAMRVHAIAFAR
jgi:predicted amidophosphoribosyltransferase